MSDPLGWKRETGRWVRLEVPREDRQAMFDWLEENGYEVRSSGPTHWKGGLVSRVEAAGRCQDPPDDAVLAWLSQIYDDESGIGDDILDLLNRRRAELSKCPDSPAPSSSPK